MDRKKILWLVSWYPNRNDRFDGDFIQRHARAAAIDNDIHVLFVTDAAMDAALEEEWNYATGLTEQLIYFKRRKGILGRVRKQITWRRLFLKAVDDYVAEHGKPDGVHVHVPWKAGLIALHLKKKRGWEFIITEHWGIYDRVVEGNYFSQPFYVRNSLKEIYQAARGLVTVSNYIGESINRVVGPKKFVILPNVVDTTLFYYKNEKYAPFTFIHVSNMAPLKNVGSILESFKRLLDKKSFPVQLILIGNRNEDYVNRARELGLLNRSVFFRGEIPYTEVAEEMRRSHGLVLFSDTETFSCVTAEALCCGLPVIANHTGALPELVNPSNGLLVPAGNTDALVDAMCQLLEQYSAYNPSQIAAAAAQKYGYSAVAAQFKALYDSQPGS